MQASHQGFVLSSTPLTDHSFLISLFTREVGLMKGVVRVGRGRRFSLSFTAALSLVSFTSGGKAQQNLKRITGLEIQRSTYDLCSSYLGLNLAQHLAHLVARSQGEHAGDERIYRLLDHGTVFVTSDAGEQTWPLALLYLESWLLRFCGMYPLNRRESPGSPMQKLFKLNIEDFTALAIEWRGLDRALETVGSMWQSYLSNELKTRTTLIESFRGKGYL